MNIKIKTGIIILITLMIISLFFTIFFGMNIELNIENRFAPAFGKSILGSDNLGRDLLSSTIYGLFFSSVISLIVVLFSSITGIIIGIIS